MSIDPTPSKTTQFGAIQFQGASRVQDNGTLGGDNPRANPVMFSVTSFPVNPQSYSAGVAMEDRILFTFEKGYYNLLHAAYTIKDLSTINYSDTLKGGYYSYFNEYYFGFDQAGYLGEFPDGTTAILIDILGELNLLNASQVRVDQPLSPAGKYDILINSFGTGFAGILPVSTNTDGDFELKVSCTPSTTIKGIFTLI